MHKVTTKFFNPKTNLWEEIETIIDKKLNYNYDHCSWVAIDGEFTGLYPKRDKSTVWSLASEDENGKMRVEMIYTSDGDADINLLKNLVESDKEKLFFYGKLDLAYLYILTGSVVKQPIYDLKIASILTRTHTQQHSLKPLVQTYISSTENIIDKSAIENADWVTDYTTWTTETFQYNVNDVIYLKYLSDKLKEVTRRAGREELVDNANKALPHLSVLYANGFYGDVFKPGYNDAFMQG